MRLYAIDSSNIAFIGHDETLDKDRTVIFFRAKPGLDGKRSEAVSSAYSYPTASLQALALLMFDPVSSGSHFAKFKQKHTGLKLDGPALIWALDQVRRYKSEGK